MSKKHQTNPKDFAFSKSAFYHPDGTFDLPEEGLTKREYFAAMAMQGLLTIPDLHFMDCVELAVKSADELINALNEEE